MKKTFFILIAFVIGFNFVSCDKDQENLNYSVNSGNLQLKGDSLGGYYTDSTFITNSGVVYSYYKDGVKRRIIEFRPNFDEEVSNTNADFYIIINSEYNTQNYLTGIRINEFSSIMDYLNYGNSLDATFSQQIQFQDQVRNYVQQNNIISQAETTGIVPESFITWHDNLRSSIFQGSPKIYYPVEVHTDYNNGYYYRTWIHPNGFALMMMPNFDNKVSRYLLWTPLWGWNHIYDKTFYRRHLVSIFSFGTEPVYFWLELFVINDRMSSFFST